MSVRLLPGPGDPVFLVDASGGNATEQLPSNYAVGRKITYRRSDSAATTFTLTVAAGQSVNGTTDGTLLVPPRGEVTLSMTDPGVWLSTGGGPIRVTATVDLASIAASATSATTVTVAGARAGGQASAAGVLCAPPAAFATAGLRLVGCYASADDTVTLVVTNPTGGAVDLAAADFTFWLVR